MIEEPKYRFVLVNDQTGESFDLDTRHVCNDGIGKDSRPDVWSSCSARNEALDRLGYSVKIVKNSEDSGVIENTEKNRIMLAKIAIEKMDLESLMCIVQDSLIESYEDSDHFENDLKQFVDKRGLMNFEKTLDNDES
jgi:hypothetical protein